MARYSKIIHSANIRAAGPVGGVTFMSRMTRRSVVLAAMLAPLSARAQSWPSGPIRIIVPFPPGGSVDAVARLAQAGLTQRLGATIVIEDRTGASGSTGS